MNTIDIISIVFLIIVALGGYGMGFGKSLKAITGGMVGIVISVFVCVAFGGTLQSLPFIKSFIETINTGSAEIWGFLEILHLGHVAFYVIMFLIVQIIRIIVVNTLAKIDYSQNKVIVVINKLLGSVLCLAFVCGIILLALAALNIFENAQFAQNIISKFSDSYLYVIYNNNPINFT